MSHGPVFASAAASAVASEPSLEPSELPWSDTLASEGGADDWSSPDPQAKKIGVTVATK
jgi:hypothetical protein